MKKLYYLAPLILLLFALFSSCEQEEEMTPRLDENGLTRDITDLVPQYILDEMERLGMPINSGGNPPNIEDTYFATPFILENSNRPGENPGLRFADYKVTFSGQDNSALTIMVDYQNGPESGTGLGSFIVGNDCKFSVFVELNSIHSGGSNAKSIQVISGNLVNNGIEDFYVANFMVDDFGDPQNVWIENGEGRIIADQDRFSEKLGQEDEWYSRLPDCPCEYTNNIDGREEMCGVWSDCGNASQEFHYGATFEVRWSPNEAGKAGQQCMYDANRQLITGGLAAGSPDRISPRSCGSLTRSTCGHYREDVLPFGNTSFTLVCGGSTNDIVPCWQYLQNWPANNGNNCTTNVISGIDHLRNILGDMNCVDVTTFFVAIDASQNASAELQEYIRGNSTTRPENLRNDLQTVFNEFNCENDANEDRCRVLQEIINNI